MTDTTSPLAGVDAQPIAVANTTGIENAADGVQKDTNVESKPDENQQPKELTPAEELDKLRRAKARDDRRIGKLTAQKYQAMKEAEDLRLRLSNNAPQKPVNGIQPSLPNGEPNPEFYSSYDELNQARIKYEARKNFAELKGEQQETAQTLQHREWLDQRGKHLDTQEAAVRKEIPDYDAVQEEYSDVVEELPAQIQQLFLEADNAPLAFYNLAKEGKLEALASMSPTRAAMEIGRAQLAFPKPKTKAPAPLPTSRGSVPSGKDPSHMTDAEFNAWRRSSIAKKR